MLISRGMTSFKLYYTFKKISRQLHNILIYLGIHKRFKMVLAKSKNAVGLGNSLMNDRFGKGRGADRKKISAGIHRTDQNGQTVSMHISILA